MGLGAEIALYDIADMDGCMASGKTDFASIAIIMLYNTMNAVIISKAT